jgi:imidazolonepropionase-like amidohydrolase
MADFIFTNLTILDAVAGKCLGGQEVRIADDRIAEIAPRVGRAPQAQVVDLGGRTLMAGLIDCHVHIHRTPLPLFPTMLPSLITAHAGATLRGMLMRGFTTVRDAGGADAGHRQAVELGLFEGPRLFVSGRALTQTGGHGDPRSPADVTPPCACTHLVAGLGRIADGVPEVRRAVRDEIRLGADQIKLMAGGGVGTVADPIGRLQYSTEELEAVVDEAHRSQTYVMAHVYTAEGIRRCVEAGVRTIEHGHFLDEATADLMAQRGAFLSTNLIIYDIIANEGLQLGWLPANVAKAREVLDVGVRALEIAQRAGVKIAFGTDLSRTPERQGDELVFRSQFMSAAQVIHDATVVGAEIVRMDHELGQVRTGMIADLLVVDGDPLADIKLLAGNGRHLPLIMKEGRVVKNELAAAAAQ